MQLSALIGRAGATPGTLSVDAAVTLSADPAGGLRISEIALTVRGRVTGLDDAAFSELAQSAKATCPVSKALAGTTISLDAALVEG
jgi:osmotically inducible protein OsmC